MDRRSSVVAAVGFFAIAALVNAATNTQPRLRGGDYVEIDAGAGRISGRVSSRGGEPLGRAVVGLRSQESGTLTLSTITNEQGAYRFDRLPAGRYVVRGTKVGFGRRFHGEGGAGQPPVVVEVEPGEHVRGIDVILPRASVITGRIVDEGGSPLSSANVVVLRQVARRTGSGVVVAGGDLTDDRGVYRVFDLDPGEYYVRAIAVSAPWLASLERWEYGGLGNGEPAGNAPDGYEPTYYPGTNRLAQARLVTVRESQEVGGVDFAVARVPFASVSGVVVAPAGANPAGAEVALMPPDGIGLLSGGNYSALVEPGGRFTLRAIPQGHYILTVTGSTANGDMAFGRQAVLVRGERVEGLTVPLAPGTEVTGTARFEGAEPQWRDIVNLRVTTRVLDRTQVRGDDQSMLDSDNGFQFRGLPPGLRVFGVTGISGDRVLDNVSLDGRDITDRPVDLSGRSRVTGLEVVLTDRVSSVRGVVRSSADGEAVAVVAFSRDPELWFPDSRHVRTERPEQGGRYRFRGIPPGDYWVAAAPLSVAGSDDWLSPRFLERLRTRATRVSVRQGDTIELDLQARIQ